MASPVSYEVMKEVFRSMRENRSIGGIITPLQLIGTIATTMIVGLLLRPFMEGNGAIIVFALMGANVLVMIIGLTPEYSNFKLFQWFFPLYRRVFKQSIVVTRTGNFSLRLLGLTSRPIVFQGFAPLLDQNIKPARAVVIRGENGEVYFAGRSVDEAESKPAPRRGAGGGG